MTPRESGDQETKDLMDNEEGEIGLFFSFVIPRDSFRTRAMLFDSLIGQSTPNCFLLSTNNMWKDLDTLKDQQGMCFVIPCTTSGVLIESASFAFRDR